MLPLHGLQYILQTAAVIVLKVLRYTVKSALHCSTFMIYYKYRKEVTNMLNKLKALKVKQATKKEVKQLADQRKQAIAALKQLQTV